MDQMEPVEISQLDAAMTNRILGTIRDSINSNLGTLIAKEPDYDYMSKQVKSAMAKATRMSEDDIHVSYLIASTLAKHGRNHKVTLFWSDGSEQVRILRLSARRAKIKAIAFIESKKDVVNVSCSASYELNRPVSVVEVDISIGDDHDSSDV